MPVAVTILNWKNGRQLHSFESDGEEYLIFEYNSDGLRTKKYYLYTDTTTNYIWSSGLLMQQSDGTNTLKFSYSPDGTPLGVRFNEKSYYYLYNLQGDVIALYNNGGNIVVEYTYDSWGKLISTTGVLAETLGKLNPFRYRGYIYDEEIECYWLRTRYYNPELGRFISSDSIIDNRTVNTLNIFSYCANNPIVFKDSSGYALETLLDICSFGYSVYELCNDPSDPANWVSAGLDLIGLFVPCVPSLGGTLKAVSYADDLYDVYKVCDKVDDAADAINTVKRSSNALDLTDGVCFVAGTDILTENGYMDIEKIRVGIKVYSFNIETGEQCLKSVVRTFINEASELIYLKIGGETIITTTEHPFYVPQKGWTEAIDLRAGDILVTVNGEYVIVEKIQHKILESPILVYNFEVEDFHTYFVSNNSILVHNDCSYKPLRDNDFRATINPGELEAPHSHIFKKNNNIGRIFRDGTMDNSLLSNRAAMRFVKKYYDNIMEMIDSFYGMR